MEPGEESPLGLLLCTEGSEEQIELLQLDKAGIKVAKYLTELPPREVLQRQIQKSLEIAKARFENFIEEDECSQGDCPHDTPDYVQIRP